MDSVRNEVSEMTRHWSEAFRNGMTASEILADAVGPSRISTGKSRLAHYLTQAYAFIGLGNSDYTFADMSENVGEWAEQILAEAAEEMAEEMADTE